MDAVESSQTGSMGIPPTIMWSDQTETIEKYEDTPSENCGDTANAPQIDSKPHTNRNVVIYIGGPYRGTCEWETNQNIRMAELAAAKYWEMGFTVICPHKNSSFMGGVVPDEEILAGDIEILRRCDRLVLLPGYLYSAGTMNERRFAQENNIPIELYCGWS